MNERIKQLAQQAQKVVAYTDGGYTEIKALDQEKFAELIVAECLSIVKSNTYGTNGEYDYSYSDEDSAADRRAETIYEEIAYRFGVAE
jgi:hypothetical protein